MSPVHALARAAGSVGLAALGGAVLAWLGLPLAWILGALAGSAVWVNLAGPTCGGRYQRRAAQLLLGAGSAAILTPEMLSSMLGFLPLMLAAAVVANGTALLAAPVFMRVAGVERITALLCVLPAGLAEMSNLAEERQARPDIVALSHSTRVAMIVILVPLVLGTDRGGQFLADTAGSATALAVCLVASLLSSMLLNRLGMLNPWIVTPMIFGAALALAGIEIMPVPHDLVVIAQILVGASLGARLKAEIFVRLPRVALAASLSTLLLSAVMLVAVSPFLILVMGVDAVTATLALAPGGIGEMLATAQALHVLVPVVLGFQFVRSLLTNLAAPVLLAWLVPSPRP